MDGANNGHVLLGTMAPEINEEYEDHPLAREDNNEHVFIIPGSEDIELKHALEVGDLGKEETGEEVELEVQMKEADPMKEENYEDNDDESRHLLDGSVEKRDEGKVDGGKDKGVEFIMMLFHFLKAIVKLFKWKRIKLLLVTIIMILAFFVFAMYKDTGNDNTSLHAVNDGCSYSESLPSNLKQDVEVGVTLQSSQDQTFFTIDLEVDGSGVGIWEICDRQNFLLTERYEQQEKVFILSLCLPLSQNQSDIHYRINVATNATLPVAFTLSCKFGSVFNIIVATVILVGVYVLIIFELLHRAISALFGAFVALAALSFLVRRPDIAEVVSWIEMDTIVLLFGMMIMVGIFSTTGAFEFVAVRAYKYSGGRMFVLTTVLSMIVAVVSAILDNVTTILLIVPTTIRMCRVFDVDPIPIVISEVIFSNIGGTATIIGDPPAVIIASDTDVQAMAGLNFLTYFIHIAPGVVISLVASWILIRILTLRSFRRKPNLGKLIEIEIWKKEARKLHTQLEEEESVKLHLQKYIRKLEKEAKKRIKSDEVDMDEILRKNKIKDIPLFNASCIIFAGVIVMFILHSVLNLSFSIAWIALVGSIVHLIVSGITNVDEILDKVEWTTLLFFVSLFILIHCIRELGLLSFLANFVEIATRMVPEGRWRLFVATFAVLWISGLVSAFMDNIPFTISILPIIKELAESDLGVPMAPLIWALAFGTCFGGNGTLIGSSAGVVASGLVESHGYRMKFLQYMKIGFPVMLVSLGTACIYNTIVHVLLGWY